MQGIRIYIFSRVQSSTHTFFHWFNVHITYPIIKNIRITFNPLSTSDADEGEVPIDQHVCMWGVSDIPYLQEMTFPERIEHSIERGILFTKIGAKITEISQPLDLGPFFKMMKVSGWHMTSVGIDISFTILVENIFQKLRKDKVSVLPKVN